MRFRRFLLTTVYGLSFCGWGAVWIAERLHPVAMLLALLALLWGPVADWRGLHPLRPNWNRFLLVFGMGLALADWRWGSGSWFLAIVLLLIYVSAVRALSPKANRDYQQMIGLAFLELLAASVLTAAAGYAFFFLAFFLLAPWGLLAVAVKAELEGEVDILRGRVAEDAAALRGSMGADRILTRGIVLSMTMALVLTMVVTVLFFATFPRLQTGTFQGQLALNEARSGLSETLELGDYGRILQDSRPAARIQVLDGTLPAADDVLLRAIVLDDFDGRTWRTTVPSRGLYSSDGEFGERRRGSLRVRIFLEDLGTNRLPVIPWATRIEMPARRLRVDAFQSYQRGSRSGPWRYEIETRPEAYRRAVNWSTLRARPVLDEELQPLVALPPLETLPAQVRAITRETDLRWVEREMRRFAGFQYTLETPVGDDTLGEFLARGAGHCELFATTLALMFRAAGIPAVVVNGFRGGEWMDDYLLVRQRNAHSWVEVLHPELNTWVPLDPTPAANFLPPWHHRVAESWQRSIDRFRLWWLDSVVEYDLATQAAAVREMRERSRGAGSTLQGWGHALQERFEGVSRVLMTVIGLAMALAALWLLRRLAGAGGRRDRVEHRARTPRWLRGLLRELERSHGARPRGLPLQVWLRETAAGDAELHAFWLRYEAWRFGGRGEAPRAEAVNLRRSLRRRRRRG